MSPMEDVAERRLERLAESLVANHRNLLRTLVRQRKDHKISQDEVAMRMGVSQPTVSEFERYDANPTLSTLRRYALAVDARLVDTVIDECELHRGTVRREHGPSFAWPGTSHAGAWRVASVREAENA